MKSYYDMYTDSKTSEADDVVYLQNPQRKPGHSPKLMQAWERTIHSY